MKKYFLILLATLAVEDANSQSYFGYRSSNYNGVNGVFFNPANIADSRYKFDLNLVGINAGVMNNTAEFNLKSISTLGNNMDSVLLNGKSGIFSGAVNLDVLGPSIMASINKRLSVAVSTRFRAIVNLHDIDTKLINNIRNTQNSSITYPYIANNVTNQKIVVNGFADIGLSAGYVLMDKGNMFLKGGATVKYLGGVANGYVNINRINGTVNEDPLPPNDVYLPNASGRIALGTGGVDINNVNVKDVLKFQSNGVGFDLGAVFEYRPDNKLEKSYGRGKDKYKLKGSLAVLDIGAITYKKTPTQYDADYTLHVSPAQKLYFNTINADDLNDAKTFMDSNPQYFTNNSTSTGNYKVKLPTTLQMAVDYNITGNIYAELAGTISLGDKNSVSSPIYYNSFSITPRYEGRNLGVAVPLTYNEISGVSAGASFRFGPLYVGSGSVLSALFGKSEQVDAHFGLRIGILQKKYKKGNTEVEDVVIRKEERNTFVRTDSVVNTKVINDTVINKTVIYDTVKNVVEQKIIDTDGDGISDELDKCPTTAGVSRYIGCPIPDSDGDGVNDEEDKCPAQKGLAKYMGCPIPDTDGDGVNDEEDKCPAIAGTIANMGCPEIKNDIVKKVNYAASRLLFATGKAQILPASFVSMNQIVAILKTDETLQLNIDGHTDNVGNVNRNLLLSQARAEAAKAYLVKKGISADRIKATGHGDTQPIASNATAAGKAKNRRIEMKVNN